MYMCVFFILQIFVIIINIFLAPQSKLHIEQCNTKLAEEREKLDAIVRSNFAKAQQAVNFKILLKYVIG